MKITFLIALMFVFFVSCSSDDVTPDSNDESAPETGFPETGISGYDVNDIPAKADPLPNLLSDESFEATDWFTCGGAQIVQDANTRSGNQLAVLDNASICEAADVPFFSTRNAILMQTMDIQELPELLTVSFWVRSDTEIPDGALTVYLTNAQNQFLESFAGGQRLITYFNEESIGDEWVQVKLYYENDGESLFLSNAPPFSVAFELEVENGYSETIEIYIDDVKISEGNETFVQPEPLPDGLSNFTDNQRILFLDRDNNTISTMRADGSNVVSHNQIATEFLNSVPQWYDNQRITVAQKVFYPAVPENTEIVPASGTDLYSYHLLNENEEIIYQTIGDAGRFSFTNTANNKEAIDIEVRRTNWDLERNRGALTVCGRARTPEFVSDEVCTINIVNAEDYSLINDELQGFNAVWSSDGRLAYYSDNALYVARVNGNNVTTEKVYQNQTINGLKQEVDWSPDGTQLVFAENVGGVTLINGTLQSMFTISLLDLNTGSVKPLLNIDHGTLMTNLSWSPDGNYILYTLNLSDQESQIWWLEVATAKTGPLTTSLNASFGYWNK